MAIWLSFATTMLLSYTYLFTHKSRSVGILHDYTLAVALWSIKQYMSMKVLVFRLYTFTGAIMKIFQVMRTTFFISTVFNTFLFPPDITLSIIQKQCNHTKAHDDMQLCNHTKVHDGCGCSLLSYNTLSFGNFYCCAISPGSTNTIHAFSLTQNSSKNIELLS